MSNDVESVLLYSLPERQGVITGTTVVHLSITFERSFTEQRGGLVRRLKYTTKHE